MEKSLNIEQHDMNKETTQYFVSGLKVAIERSGMSQTEFSNGVTSKTNLSNILRGKVGTSDDMKSKLASKAGLDTAEIVALGRANNAVAGGNYVESTYGTIDRRDPVLALTELANSFRKQEKQIAEHAAWLEGVTVPICVVNEDNEVVFQNQANRALYKMNVVGEKLCPACRVNHEFESPCDDCAVDEAFSVGESTTKEICVCGKDYLLTANPVATDKKKFVVITVIEKATL